MSGIKQIIRNYFVNNNKNSSIMLHNYYFNCLSLYKTEQLRANYNNKIKGKLS